LAASIKLKYGPELHSNSGGSPCVAVLKIDVKNMEIMVDWIVPPEPGRYGKSENMDKIMQVI
jgi:hypothetical protein